MYTYFSFIYGVPGADVRLVVYARYIDKEPRTVERSIVTLSTDKLRTDISLILRPDILGYIDESLEMEAHSFHEYCIDMQNLDR